MYRINPYPDKYQEMFDDDIREKKKAASGVRFRKGGGVGSLVFPFDIMSRSEKYRYRKAGKVVKWNMYEIILPYDEFLKQNEKWRRRLLTEWRKRFSDQEIQARMGISQKAWRSTCEKYAKVVTEAATLSES